MFASLRHRNFRLMWFSLLISNSGTWLQSVAQDYAVYQLTHRAIDLGYVNAARAVALIGLSFFGGSLVDRFEKRKVLIVTQTLFGLCAILLGALVAADRLQVWHVVVVSFVTAALLAVDQPARQALLPHLVPREQFANAIALNSITFTGAAALGPAMAAPVVHAFGMAWGFYLNGLSYLAVIGAVWALRVHEGLASENPSVIRNVGAGLRYVRDSPGILLLVSLLAVLSFFATPYQSLLPVFAVRLFHGGVATLAALRTAPGIGAIAGGFLVAWLASIRGKAWISLGAGLLCGVMLVAFCAVRSLEPALLLLFLVGTAGAVVNATIQTLMQHLTSHEMRGRVMSLFTISVIGMWPLGALPMSWLADRWGVAAATAAGASVAALYAALVAVTGRRLVNRIDAQATL
ncbi:MAG: MFS transporter [Armatimonadetes bacterium]|nr:MFS transporter [Armatimonadota bacterium]MDE2207133.1 MFS transporter [Armatimonadota bacterium]